MPTTGYISDLLNGMTGDERLEVGLAIARFANPNVANYMAAECLPKTRAAKARVACGTGRGKILCIGDSTTSGALRSISYPNRMADRLNKLGLAASAESVCGNQNQASSYATYDPRVNPGTWGYDVGRVTLGQAAFRLDTATGAWTFLPIKNVDTFVIKYLVGSGFGTSAITIDGAAPSTGPASIAAANATTAFQYATVKAASVGAHTLGITKTATGAFFICEVIAYDSTVPGFDIVNAGWPTSRSTNWNVSGNPFNPIEAIQSGGYDTVIIGLGINDWDNNVPLATTIANLTPLVNAAKVNSDCILIGQPQTNPTRNASAATQATFLQAIADLAGATNSLFFNIAGRSGSWAQANAAGMMADDVHPNQFGYADWGGFLADVIARA